MLPKEGQSQSLAPPQAVAEKRRAVKAMRDKMRRFTPQIYLKFGA